MPVVLNSEREKDMKQKANNSGNNAFVSDSTPMPKHIPFPEISATPEIICELIMTAFTISAALLQFINIFRTHWWMENSFIHHTISLEMININLVFLIMVIATRRLLYLLLIRLIVYIRGIPLQKKEQLILKYAYAGGVFCVISALIIRVYLEHTIILAMFLSYPFMLYLIIFGFHLEPFLRSFWEIEGAYFNGMPFHSCSLNPASIREEVETLRTDYNRRFKQILFTSFINAYYAGFVPCFIANRIHYNVVWAGQHVFFTWLSGFMMCTVFLFPAKYCDVLHRASLHLGLWQKLDSTTYEDENGAATEYTTTSWNKNTIWIENSFVKYNNTVFRSLTPFTVAWPSNSTHTRFYKLFHTPEQIFLYMFCVQGSLIMTQILLLFFSIEWHYMLSITFIAFTNQYTFFKIARDYLVTKRVYTAESSTLADKHYE